MTEFLFWPNERWFLSRTCQGHRLATGLDRPGRPRRHAADLGTRQDQPHSEQVRSYSAASQDSLTLPRYPRSVSLATATQPESIAAVARRHEATLLACDVDLERVARVIGVELDQPAG